MGGKPERNTEVIMRQLQTSLINLLRHMLANTIKVLEAHNICNVLLFAFQSPFHLRACFRCRLQKCHALAEIRRNGNEEPPG